MNLEKRALTAPYIADPDAADALTASLGAAAPIDQMPWGNPNAYAGRAWAYIAYSREALHVAFQVCEPAVKASYTRPNDPVSADSAVEFFFRPLPDACAPYINCELNALGTMLAKYSQKLGDFIYIDRTDDTRFHIHTDFVPGEKGPQKEIRWNLSFRMPYTVIRRYYPDAVFERGSILRANFHKCGHETEKPHYLVWNCIDGEPEPQFHAPSSFGPILLG